jgi:hypothetical protein
MAEGYRRMLPLLQGSGIVVDDLKITELKLAKGDAASLVRGRGSEEPGKKPFSNTIARAARGRHVVELVLRNLDLNDAELSKVLDAALDRAAELKATGAPPAK